MEIVYRACDGEEFDSQEACLKHEKKYVTFKMYTHCGEPTYSVEEALLVNLCQPRGGKDFVWHCETEGEYGASNGINKDSKPGWYWWHEGSYVLVDDDMITALYNAGYFSNET